MSKTCEEQVQSNFESRIKDIRELWMGHPDELAEYGLSMDYVKPGTFKNQKAGYWRWQLSYGGPADEFRVYGNGEVEYWFLDWYDGAKIDVKGKDKLLVIEEMSGPLDIPLDVYRMAEEDNSEENLDN